MTVIIYPDVEIWNYILCGVASREDIILIPLNQYCNKFQQFVRKALKFTSLPPSWIFNHELVTVLSKLKKYDCIIVADYSLPCIYYAIRQICGEKVKLNFWLWNPTSDDSLFEEKINHLIKTGVSISTFDKNDSINYDLDLKDQFYTSKAMSCSPLSIEYDFYFLGCPKNRMKELGIVRKMVSCYHNKFVIPTNVSEYITYEQNIKFIESSRCIIDIVQPGQNGMTLRPLEALFMRKKLLTNYSEIRETKFYNPDNIFIIGFDDENRLKDFLYSPFNDKVLKYQYLYDVNTWVDSFRNRI